MNLGHAALQRSTRIDPSRCALLIVDVQNSEIAAEVERDRPAYCRRIREQVIPRIRQLIATARETGVEVVYTTIESLTRDGRDRSLDHKLSNMFIPKGDWKGRVIDAVAPGDDDIVLAKTSSGVFNSTNLDYLLRNMGIEAVAVVGLLTDQCVDMAVRDGADRGYFMLCVEDACTTHSEARHSNALRAFGGYCRLTRTDDFCAEMRRAPP